MHEIDVRNLDLNLLVALDVLLEEQHVTKAAARLGRSQSAVSHALARLREHLGDPILARVGGRMEPTPRGRQLAPELKRVLQTLDRILTSDLGWDPAASTRTFRLVAPDFLAAILPELAASMSAVAPDAQLELVAPARGLLRDIALGRFDLAVAPQRLPLEEGVVRRGSLVLPWSVFARRDHPATEEWGLEGWLAYSHVRVRTPAAGAGPIDEVLERLGLRRRLGPLLPHFMLAPALLAATDMLLTVPRGVLAGVAERFELVELPCPVEVPPLRLAVYESRLSASDPALSWFRGEVERALSRCFGP
ncbi:MAG: LysR family transcriptional regulator [Myxococcota bacterium]